MKYEYKINSTKIFFSFLSHLTLHSLQLFITIPLLRRFLGVFRSLVENETSHLPCPSVCNVFAWLFDAR